MHAVHNQPQAQNDHLLRQKSPSPTAVLQRSDTPQRGSATYGPRTILQMQRQRGNRYVQRQLANTVQRCGPGGCTCGGKCGGGAALAEDDAQSMPAQQPVQRSLIEVQRSLTPTVQRCGPGGCTCGGKCGAGKDDDAQRHYQPQGMVQRGMFDWAKNAGRAIGRGARAVGGAVANAANEAGEFVGDMFGGAEREGCQQDPAWEYEYDGCSVPGWVSGIMGIDDKDNPAGGSDTHFARPDRQGACDAHDRCYQTCNPDGGGRTQCDSRMYQAMLATCRNSSESEDVKNSCKRWARIYYTGLQVGGGGAWNDRQETVCSCGGGR